jgi:Na+/H+-dicarboxylate symporter
MMIKQIFDAAIKTLVGRLVLCILFVMLMGPNLPYEYIQAIYTGSFIIVEFLNIIVPFVVFIYLVSSLINIGEKSHFYIAFILLAVFVSNAFSLLAAYGICQAVLPLFSFQEVVILPESTLVPLFQLNFGSLIRLDITILIGFCVSMFLIYTPLPLSFKATIHTYLQKAQSFLNNRLLKFFIFLLPFYVLGFMLKMYSDGFFAHLYEHYLPMVLLNVSFPMVYLLFLYYIAAKLLSQKLSATLRPMAHAGYVAFSTMSSNIALPFTIAGTNKNLKKPSVTQLVLTSTANIHVIGDNLVVTITAMALLLANGYQLPDMGNFVLFIIFFSIANLSTVGIPGGTIVLIMPIIQKYLGLTPELTSALAVLYILQDPIITTTNVLGNGAFCILFGKFLPAPKGEATFSHPL